MFVGNVHAMAVPNSLNMHINFLPDRELLHVLDLDSANLSLTLIIVKSSNTCLAKNSISFYVMHKPK